jgi:hypothetical protein
MVFLFFFNDAAAAEIYTLEPLETEERGSGRRTKVWVEGIAEPIIASRTERTILHDMGHDASAASPIIDQSLELAELIAEQSESGKVDLTDLGRRARRLLEASAKQTGSAKLF